MATDKDSLIYQSIRIFVYEITPLKQLHSITVTLKISFLPRRPAFERVFCQ